jgi:primosomal protein N' (replication factor Y)
MVSAVVRGARFMEAMREATALAAELRGKGGFEVLGPAPAPIARVKGEHRVQIFLKGTHRPEMREALQAAIQKRPALQRRTTIDVDPLSVL